MCSLLVGRILRSDVDVIRLVSPQDEQEKRIPLARPENERHYRNAYGRHAPSFLQQFVNRMRSLSLIPIHSNGAGDLSGIADFCDERFHEYLVRLASHQIY